MKTIIPVILLLLFSTQVFARTHQTSNLFRKAEPSYQIKSGTSQAIDHVEWLEPAEEELKKLLNQQPEQISLNIPSSRGAFVLDLQRIEVESPEFRIRTSGGKLFSLQRGKILHYRGSVRGKKASLASMSFSENEISILFSAGSGNYNLVKYKGAGGSLYALFNDLDILGKNPFQCHSEGLSPASGNKSLPKFKVPNGEIQSGNCRRVDLYFECDHQLFLDRGSSVEASVNYVQSLFNVVASIYAQDGVNIRISEIFVHTQPDAYPSATSFEALGAFMDSVNARPPFNGNLGHLLSSLPRANGGVAYLDVLCGAGTGFNIGYSNIYNSFLPLPYYSWNVNVLTHELGHNFGSPHTQSCSWETSPGVFGMLDSCYFAEGECYTGPRIASRGTQMSYCHLMNLGIDMSKGFGLLPGTLIRNNYLNAPCLSGSVDFPPLSISPADSICRGSTLNLAVSPVSGASYQWSGPGGFSASTASVSIPNAGPAQEGKYSVIVSKDGCDALPLSTSISVNCIYAIPQSNRIPCRQSSFSVDYQTSFTPSAGNQFLVEMSNASGSFANPLTIGSLSSTASQGSITVQLPAALLPDSGYLLRIRSSNPARIGEAGRQSLQVLALPPPPFAQDTSRCGSGSLLLQAIGAPGDSLFWFASENASDPIASGNFFSTPVLNTSTSYWAGTRRIRGGSVGPVPDFSTGDTLTVANTYHGLFLKVSKTLSLDSVLVFASGPGKIHFNLKDSANTFLYRKLVRDVVGSTAGEKISLGLEVSPGFYRLDAEKSTVPGLMRLNNYYSFPLISEGMDILGSSVPGRYYFFYDLKYRILECHSERKEVRAEVFPLPAAPVLIQSGQYLISSADTLQQWYLNGQLLGTFGDTLDAGEFGNGLYQTVLLTGGSCGAGSNLLSVSFTLAEDKFGFGGSILYPNPVKDWFSLKAVNEELVRIQLFDLTGKKILEAAYQHGNKIAVSQLSCGSYIMEASFSGGRNLRQLMLKE